MTVSVGLGARRGQTAPRRRAGSRRGREPRPHVTAALERKGSGPGPGSHVRARPKETWGPDEPAAAGFGQAESDYLPELPESLSARA